ncbi:molybdate ABC transporter substrate-binding protein [Motiliproteus sp. MSK22-1]|nr:molybdate ABC transporter substrate-binding protein [Motiliproteus sp. MSK22-1]
MLQTAFGILLLVSIQTLCGLTAVAQADNQTIRVAVASNFSETMRVITQRYEQQSGHKVKLIFGSTGKHFAQIHNGAPFDLFFAADARRPRLLESSGKSVPGSRYTYALGRLALWSPDKLLVQTGGKILEQGNYSHIAIANPKLAPYGKAAQEILQSRNLWNKLQRRLVRGENIGQAFQFIQSGNVELGFVSFSQITHPEKKTSGSFWLIPESLHSPIEQQAVLITDSERARDFYNFVRSDQSLDIIRSYGYGIPATTKDIPATPNEVIQ